MHWLSLPQLLAQHAAAAATVGGAAAAGGDGAGAGLTGARGRFALAAASQRAAWQTVPLGYFWQPPMPLHLPLSPQHGRPHVPAHRPWDQGRWRAPGCTDRGRWAGRRSGRGRRRRFRSTRPRRRPRSALVAGGAVLAVAPLAAAAAGAGRRGHALAAVPAGGDAGAVFTGGRCAREGDARLARAIAVAHAGRQELLAAVAGAELAGGPGGVFGASALAIAIAALAAGLGRVLAAEVVGILGAGGCGDTFAHAVGLVAAHAGAGAGDVAADAVTAEPRIAIARLVADGARRALGAAGGAGTADALLANAGRAVGGAVACLPRRPLGSVCGQAACPGRQHAVSGGASRGVRSGHAGAPAASRAGAQDLRHLFRVASEPGGQCQAQDRCQADASRVSHVTRRTRRSRHRPIDRSTDRCADRDPPSNSYLPVGGSCKGPKRLARPSRRTKPVRWSRGITTGVRTTYMMAADFKGYQCQQRNWDRARRSRW